MKVGLKQKISGSLVLFFITFAVYTALSYGGVRSPDGELLFRVGESFAGRFEFSVDDRLPWKDFVAIDYGVDGKLYSGFGPAQSVLIFPFIKLARYINRTGWFNSGGFYVPVSHYVSKKDFTLYLQGKDPEERQQHALRFIVSFFNIVISSLNVVFFFILLIRMTSSVLASFLTSILLAFSTLLMHYSGTFFAEPLAILAVLISFYFLIINDEKYIDKGPSVSRVALSGTILGLSVFAHISTILFAPFFFLYAVYPYFKNVKKYGDYVLPAMVFFAGVMLFFGANVLFNYTRFGHGRVLEGTIIDTIFLQGGKFTSPWRGLFGLVLGCGKGILLFCPVIILGILSWPRLSSNHKFLSMNILAAVVFRVIFIATRNDWHGGFCLGPRILLMIIPFMLISAGLWLSEFLRNNSNRFFNISICRDKGGPGYGNNIFLHYVRKLQMFLRGNWKISGIIVFVFLAIYQQIYFCIGEIYTFLHSVKWHYMKYGKNVFDNDWIYLSCDVTPLLYLLKSKKAPFMFHASGLDNYGLWAVCCLFITFLILIVMKIFIRYSVSKEHPLILSE